MESIDDCHDIDLPTALVAKAESELNEKSEWRQRDIQALKELILANKNLHGRMEDHFLLRFLRARKFDYDRAYSLYLNYYLVRREHPEVFSNFWPSAIKPVLDRGITSVHKDPDAQGRRVLLFRPGLWNVDEFPNTELLRANLICVEILLNDPATQISGIVIVVDLAQFGWRQANQFGLAFARRASRFMQDTTPVRVKSIHFVHEPTIFSYAFAVLKPFLKEKIQRRLNLHGSSLDSLTQHVPASLLPSDCELNGTGPALPDQIYIDSVMEREPEFALLDEYFLDSEGTVLPEQMEDQSCVPGLYNGDSGDL